MPDGFELGYATICTLREDVPEDKLADLIWSAESISQPDFLPNKEVYVAEGEFNEYKITYSDGKTEAPTEPMVRSVILSDVFNDNVFHVHSYLKEEHFEEGVEKHIEMIESAEEMEMSVFSAMFISDTPMSEVLKATNLVNMNGEGGVVGALEFERNDWEVTISERPVESSMSFFQYGVDEVMPVSDIEQSIFDHVEDAEKCMEEVLE